MVDLPEEVHADLALVDNVHLLKQIISNLEMFFLENKLTKLGRCDR